MCFEGKLRRQVSCGKWIEKADILLQRRIRRERERECTPYFTEANKNSLFQLTSLHLFLAQKCSSRQHLLSKPQQNVSKSVRMAGCDVVTNDVVTLWRMMSVFSLETMRRIRVKSRALYVFICCIAVTRFDTKQSQTCNHNETLQISNVNSLTRIQGIHRITLCLPLPNWKENL